MTSLFSRFRLAGLFALVSLFSIPSFAQTSVIHVPVSNCAGTVATTAFTSTYPKLVQSAAGNYEMEFGTTSTAGTLTIDCAIVGEGLTNGRTTIGAIEFCYGVQTTNLSSIATPVITTVTYGTEGSTTAAGTVTTAGGTKTVIPASLPLTTTTNGRAYCERVTFATPIPWNRRNMTVFEQVFTTAGSTATIVQVFDVRAFIAGAPSQ